MKDEQGCCLLRVFALPGSLSLDSTLVWSPNPLLGTFTQNHLLSATTSRTTPCTHRLPLPTSFFSIALIISQHFISFSFFVYYPLPPPLPYEGKLMSKGFAVLFTILSLDARTVPGT